MPLETQVVFVDATGQPYGASVVPEMTPPNPTTLYCLRFADVPQDFMADIPPQSDKAGRVIFRARVAH